MGSATWRSSHYACFWFQLTFLLCISNARPPSTAMPSRNAASDWYEITKHHSVLIDGKYTDLPTKTNAISPPPAIPLSAVSLNGHALQSQLAEPIVRVGPLFSYTHLRDGNVLSVHGPGLHLLPITGSRKPSHFVNWFRILQSNSHYNNGLNNPIAQITSNNTVNSGRMELALCDREAPPHLLQIALAFDNTFCSHYANNATRAIAAARAAIHMAGRPFAKDTCIRLRIRSVEAHCADPRDPYVSLIKESKVRGFGVLDGLQNIWAKRRAHVKRDVVMLFVGFEHEFYFGQASVGETCDGRGFSWVELADVRTALHELGHLLSAEHSDAGIMALVQVPGQGLFFNDASVREMEAYVASPLGHCIRPGSFRGSPTMAQPTQTKTQEGSPNTSPTPRQRMCSSTFTRSISLACTSEDLGTIKTKLGSINIRMEQTRARFKAKLYLVASEGEAQGHLKTKNRRLVWYKTRLSSNPHVTEKMLGARVTVSGGDNIVVRWPSSSLRLAKGSSSCCGARLYLYAAVKLTQTVVDRSGKVKGSFSRSALARFDWTVVCHRCKLGGIIASAVRKCPQCRRD